MPDTNEKMKFRYNNKEQRKKHQKEIKRGTGLFRER